MGPRNIIRVQFDWDQLYALADAHGVSAEAAEAWAQREEWTRTVERRLRSRLEEAVAAGLVLEEMRHRMGQREG